MADTADTKLKDVGSRPTGYTIQVNGDGGVIDRQFASEAEANQVLTRCQSLTPPLLPNGKVVPVLGTIAERKGGRGRKSNAEKAAQAAQVAQAAKPSEAPTGNAKPEKAAASAGSMR